MSKSLPLDESRQAGVEIEITPAMMRAGKAALGPVEIASWDEEEWLIARLYRAMEKAREAQQ